MTTFERADEMDSSGRALPAERVLELNELERFERRWWSMPYGWKRKARIAIGKPFELLFALREAQKGAARYGPEVAGAHGVSIRRQRAALFSAALKYRFSAETFYLYQIYQDSRQRAIRSFIPKERLTVLLEYLVHNMQPADTSALLNKRLFREYGERHGLPTIPVLAEFNEGNVTPRAWHPGVALPSVDLFAKAANLWCGIDAKRWLCVGEDRFSDTNGNIVRSNDVVAEMLARSVGFPQILQPRVRNHARLDRLSRGGLCTVRLVTCRRPGKYGTAENGRFDYLPPVLRMPTGDSIVDNFAQGGLAAPIDARTGQLGQKAIRRDPSMVITAETRHPDTHEQFDGFQLPFWSQVVALGIRAHAAFPSMPFIGWDIALLDRGPVLVEGNVFWDSDLTQLPHGIGLGDTQFVAYYNAHVRTISHIR